MSNAVLLAAVLARVLARRIEGRRAVADLLDDRLRREAYDLIRTTMEVEEHRLQERGEEPDGLDLHPLSRLITP